MTYTLQLIFDADTLSSHETHTPMRTGALGALSRLSLNGVMLCSETSRLPALTRELLKQEHIEIAAPQTTVDASLVRAELRLDNEGRLCLSMPDSPKDAQNPRCFDNWQTLTGYLLRGRRTATRKRTTAETDISVTVNLDGTGRSNIHTGLAFYDHMLEQIARHGYIDLDITCQGDLHIDEHHTIEDTAIVLGETIGEALGNKRGIGRYGFVVAMDESRSVVAIDLSGRPWCVFEGSFSREKVGDFPVEMTSHFFHSLAMALRATVHVTVQGENDHHQIEACFKGLARSLRQAVDRNENYLDILPSSKDLL